MICGKKGERAERKISASADVVRESSVRTDMICMMTGAGSLGMRYARAVEELA